jgi:pilus assembly protein FimV
MITGALALIVLIIAWLLRRANAVRDDDADGGSGLITEAMVQKKLDQINLDLSQDPLDSAASTGAMQNARPDPIRGNQG